MMTTRLGRSTAIACASCDWLRPGLSDTSVSAVKVIILSSNGSRVRARSALITMKARFIE